MYDDEYIDSDALSISSSVEDVMDCDTRDYNGDCGSNCDSSDENETSTNLESANNNVATLTQPQHDSESQHLESCVIHACTEHTETETEEQGIERLHTALICIYWSYYFLCYRFSNPISLVR